MKKMIVAATLLALAGASLPTAKAGDCGWSPAGKILTGLAVGVAVANTVYCQPAYCPVTYSPCASSPTVVVYAPAPAILPAPVVYAPAPVVVYPRPVFITPRPLVNVNYAYGRGYPNRGHGHGYRR
jgi:hypothetical protein